MAKKRKGAPKECEWQEIPLDLFREIFDHLWSRDEDWGDDLVIEIQNLPALKDLLTARRVYIGKKISSSNWGEGFKRNLLSGQLGEALDQTKKLKSVEELIEGLLNKDGIESTEGRDDEDYEEDESDLVGYIEELSDDFEDYLNRLDNEDFDFDDDDDLLEEIDLNLTIESILAREATSVCILSNELVPRIIPILPEMANDCWNLIFDKQENDGTFVIEDLWFIKDGDNYYFPGLDSKQYSHLRDKAMVRIRVWKHSKWLAAVKKSITNGKLSTLKVTEDIDVNNIKLMSEL